MATFVDTASGARLAYRVLSPHLLAATPLVMVRGLGGTKEDWNDVPALLAATRPVLIFDNRGVGESSIPEGPYSMRDYVDDTLAVVAHAGFARFALLGTSLGGMIAQNVALRALEDDYKGPTLERLVLCCTHFGGPNYVRSASDAAFAAMVPVGPVTPEVEQRVEATFTAFMTRIRTGGDARFDAILANIKRSRRGIGPL